MSDILKIICYISDIVRHHFPADCVHALVRRVTELVKLERLPGKVGSELVEVGHHAQFVRYIKDDHVWRVEKAGNTEGLRYVKRLRHKIFV